MLEIDLSQSYGAVGADALPGNVGQAPGQTRRQAGAAEVRDQGRGSLLAEIPVAADLWSATDFPGRWHSPQNDNAAYGENDAREELRRRKGEQTSDLLTLCCSRHHRST